MLIGNLILSKNVAGFSNPLFTSRGSFFPGTVVTAATRSAVRSRLAALNTEVVNAAKAAGANTYDPAGLFSRLRAQGVQVGSKTLTADFLGGFYSLDNYYPGAVGHGLIANEVLTQLNQVYKTSFPLLDIAKIAATTRQSGSRRRREADRKGGIAVRRNRIPLFCATAWALTVPLAGKAPLPVRLRLPPGLVQTLQVDKAGSYMGDAVRIPDCPNSEATTCLSLSRPSLHPDFWLRRPNFPLRACRWGFLDRRDPPVPAAAALGTERGFDGRSL